MQGGAGPGLSGDNRFGGDLPERLRESFLTAGYTAEGVLHALGGSASAALARGERVPARRAASGDDPLTVLIRLLLLHDPVPARQASAVLPVQACQEAGVLESADDDCVRAGIDIRPYAPDDADGPWWIASDRGREYSGGMPVRQDFVLGVGGASTTLAQLVVRSPVERALDVGTGCGVQALHLSRHSRSIVATDVLPRALDFARLTAGLCGVTDEQLDLRLGSLYEPVVDDRFDLVVVHPPFVVHPGGSGDYVYRDSGLPGDEVCARLVARAADHLADGGYAQMLGNWIHARGEQWQERVARWLPSGVDAWIVQRDVQDPAEYVSLWLTDSGEVDAPDYEQRYDAWLSSFERAGIDGVGFGWICLRASGSDSVSVRIEEWPHAVEQPLGPTVAAEWRRQDALRRLEGARLLGACLRVAPDVRQEQHGLPGAEDPEVVLLRQQAGMRRADHVGTELAALIGACDGTVPVEALLAAVAQVCERPVAELTAELLPAIRQAVESGFLLAD